MSTRARLLEAALGALAVRGYHGTSTRDIARAAQMSPAAVYAHFSTKEELLFRLSLGGHTDVRDRVLSAAARSSDPAIQLRNIVREFVAWHARFHTQARVVQYEMAALSPEHAARIAVLRRETQSMLRDVLNAGIDQGVFAMDSPRSVARAIVSLAIDVARWYDPEGSATPQDIGAEYADLALCMAIGFPPCRSHHARCGCTECADISDGQKSEGGRH